MALIPVQLHVLMFEDGMRDFQVSLVFRCFQA